MRFAPRVGQLQRSTVGLPPSVGDRCKEAVRADSCDMPMSPFAGPIGGQALLLVDNWQALTDPSGSDPPRGWRPSESSCQGLGYSGESGACLTAEPLSCLGPREGLGTEEEACIDAPESGLVRASELPVPVLSNLVSTWCPPSSNF